jgi:GTPase KRas protein
MGAAAVGKSNVTLRYVKNETYDYYDPTLMDEYKKNATIDDKPCVVRVITHYYR